MEPDFPESREQAKKCKLKPEIFHSFLERMQVPLNSYLKLGMDKKDGAESQAERSYNG